MIHIVRTRNPLVTSWWIHYNSKWVGSIVKSMDDYLVVRNKPTERQGEYQAEIATRKKSFAEARDFVMNGGDR